MTGHARSGRLTGDVADAVYLHRLAQSFLETCAAGCKEAVDVGPVRAFLSSTRPGPLMSVAVPARTAIDWAPAIASLKELFAVRKRSVRLEFFEELYPDLAPALEEAGVPREMTAPVMVVTPDTFWPRLLDDEEGFVMLDPEDDALVDDFLISQAEAFEMECDLGETGWKPTLLAGLRDGSVLAGATRHEGRVVAAASLLLGADAAELAGVATLPHLRRRGLAADVCSRLLERYFGDFNELSWLSAGEDAQGLYTRMGFREVGTQLNHGCAPS